MPRTSRSSPLPKSPVRCAVCVHCNALPQAMADEGEARGAAALAQGLADVEASVSSRLAETEAYLRWV
eukprot:364768-Chlamydomonas_euryale.AAC.10